MILIHDGNAHSFKYEKEKDMFEDEMEEDNDADDIFKQRNSILQASKGQRSYS